MGAGISEIIANAEQDVQMLMIPIEEMVRLIQNYNGWMQFVFMSLNQRITELIEADDSLAFLNLHERLIQYSKSKSVVTKSTQIESTHMEIANDLHSSRVVISRLLKRLEHEGVIKMNRNHIELLEI
jgi:CRP/FNR family transcriptional regulator